MVTRTILMCAVWTAGMVFLSGCGGEGDSASDVSQPDAGAPEALEVTVTPEMTGVLAKADALDGETDKIVSRCASCALGMAGSSEHALQVGEYTMYFCAVDCKESFSEDIPKSVLAMNVPAPEEGDTQ